LTSTTPTLSFSSQFFQRLCISGVLTRRADRFYSSSGNVKSLVVGEHDGKQLTPATLSTLTASLQISTNTSLLIFGSPSDSKKVAEWSGKVKGLSKVLYAQTQTQVTGELLASVVKSLLTRDPSITHLLSPSSSLSKSFAPRLAALLNVSPLTDVTKIVSPDTFVRPICAGNALATIQSSDPFKILLIRGTAFEKAAVGEGAASVEDVSSLLTADEISKADALSKHVRYEVTKSDRPELTSARIVVSGGRALKSKENFSIIEQLADKFGAAVGASRAAVDAGYAPNDMQVGQTGKIVAPDLYLAFGISGAIQHLAGMKDSKIIVAVNKDPEAPIFQLADYGLVDDLFKVIPELTKLAQKK